LRVLEFNLLNISAPQHIYSLTDEFMSLVITLAHQKGGVGKSTLATNLRGYFAGGGYKAALVDIDPQGSLSKLVRTFSEQAGREPEHIIERSSFKSYEELRELITPYDIVIIDTPPYLSQDLEAVFAISNLVLIPCKASPLDFLAIGDTLDLVREAQSERPELLAAIVLTMVITGTDFTASIRHELQKSEFPVLETEIGNRVAFMRSLLRSNSVLGDDNRKASQEIESLGKELISLLQTSYGN
jgi:chromosome partitioning protein